MAADSSASESAPHTATNPPMIQSRSMSWLLPTKHAVYPDVVKTPTPTMLEITTNVAVANPMLRGGAARTSARSLSMVLSLS